ncbi:MAG: phosphotransferase [Nocardioidaceae bacterium]
MSEHLAASCAADDFAALAEVAFGVTSTAVPLAGEHDANARLDVAGRPRYVLKVHAPGSDRIELQDAVLTWLAEHEPPVRTPRLVSSTNANVAGSSRRVRLLDWIDGKVWARITPTEWQLHALGVAVAELDRSLEGFDHPDLAAPYRWNLIDAGSLRTSAASLPAELQPFVDRVDQRLDDVLAALRKLPSQAIHNDANEHNVLVGADGSIAGILDVGDVVRAPRVGGLAVAAAYSQLGAADPVAATLAVVRGYHSSCPLTPGELELLPDLIDLRLAMSIRNAADQQRDNPGNAYLSVSQPMIREAVLALADEPPELRAARYRTACDLPAVESEPSVVGWLRGPDCTPASILRHDLRRAKVEVLDWSPAGPQELRVTGGPLRVAGEIDGLIGSRGAALAAGRYQEHRDVYRSDAFASNAADGERRTVHLGVDLFVPAGEPVYAALDAIVHTVEFRADRYDYGGVVLLEHATGDGVPFWLLAGHLSAESAATLRPGQRLCRGDRFGSIGDVTENGGWPPHVHVQLFTRLFGRSTDLPGVVRRSELACWESISPDPNLLLGIPTPVRAVPDVADHPTQKGA